MNTSVAAHDTATPKASAGSVQRLSAVTTVWCMAFALVHFYWAAGGEAGTRDGAASSLGMSFYIALIAVLGLAGAGLARGLCQPWGARFGRRRLRAVARLGTGMLLLGVAIGVGRWITAGGIGDDGVPGVIITGYFLLGGGLFAALSRASKR